MRQRERERVREWICVYLCMREKQGESVCMKERDIICVCEIETEKECV